MLAAACCSSSSGRSPTRSSTSRRTRTPCRRWSRSSRSRRVERRGDGAIRHRPARDRPVGHAGPRAHPVAVLSASPTSSATSTGRPSTTTLGRRSSTASSSSSCRRAAGAALAVERHRRGVPLPRRRQGLHAQGLEDRGGLDPRAPVQAGAGRHRRHELRRRDQAVPREVDPFRLRGHGVTLGQLTSAIQNSNQNVGGHRLFMGEQSYDVRGIGLLGSRNRAARHREHRRRRAEGDPGSRQGRGRHRHRQRAAPRDRRLRRRTPTSCRASS